MGDLISRSALKAYIQANGMVYANTLDTFPTVDPVKHGRWITGNDFYGNTVCSECGALKSGLYSNYCPRCGADMREGEP